MPNDNNILNFGTVGCLRVFCCPIFLFSLSRWTLKCVILGKTMHTGEMTMQYKILASDYDNTLMPFGEAKPRPAVVKAVKSCRPPG